MRMYVPVETYLGGHVVYENEKEQWAQHDSLWYTRKILRWVRALPTNDIRHGPTH